MHAWDRYRSVFRSKVNHAHLEELRVLMRRLLNASDLDALFV